MSTEKILCSAIHWDDGKEYKHQPKNITRGIVVCGWRHHNCFAILSEITASRGIIRKDRVIQGFLTNIDRFVDRKEAMKIATVSGIIIKKGSILTSEDLY